MDCRKEPQIQHLFEWELNLTGACSLDPSQVVNPHFSCLIGERDDIQINLCSGFVKQKVVLKDKRTCNTNGKVHYMNIAIANITAESLFKSYKKTVHLLISREDLF
jgi:hypothetical protein